MSVRSYRGNRGKNVFEVSNFSKGVNATNAVMPQGYLKELVNMNISPDGISLRPREPYLNYALFDSVSETFLNLSPTIGVFTSKQYPRKEFIVDFYGTRQPIEKQITNYRIVDGDTIVDNDTNTTFRFLLVDAPELETDGGKASKLFIESNTEGKPIRILIDPYAPSTVDAYGRTLAFVINYKGQNLSKLLIENKMAKYLDYSITYHYFMKDYSFVGLKDTEDKELNISEYIGYNPAVFLRDLDKGPTKHDDRPVYIVEQFEKINMGDMLLDLELDYSYLPKIEVRTTKKETQHYSVNQNSIIQSELPNLDGVISIVDIDGIYGGLMSVELFIPFKDDSETIVDFDNPYILFKTYNKDIKEVKFEDLSRHSQNLLDKHTIKTESYYGEGASEKGYNYPTIRSILFKNEDGDIVSQLQRNKKYYIDPLVALPLLDGVTNGYEDVDGYAYKWDIIIHNNSTSDSREEVIHTIPWTYSRDMDGTVVDAAMAFVSMRNVNESDKLRRWTDQTVSNRFLSKGTIPSVESVGGNIQSILRIPKRGSRIKGYVTEYRYETQSGYEEDEVQNRDLFPNPVPKEHDANGATYNVVQRVYDTGLGSNLTYQAWKDIDFTKDSIMGQDTPPYTEITFRDNYILDDTYHTFVAIVKTVAVDYDYYEVTTVEETTRLNNKLTLFNNSTEGLQVRFYIAPAKNSPTYNDDYSSELNLNAQIMTSAYMPYQSEEFKMPELVNTSTIWDTKHMAFFEDMLVLYGGEKHGNIIYLSDFSNISYFPFKYALDQIPQEIVHIHSYQNILIVFTKSDIWTIEKFETENEFGVITTDFIAKRVLQNIYIDTHLKNTIKTVGKNVMMMLEDKVIFLKPNSFTGDNTDLSYMEVSAPIGTILKNPEAYVRSRLKYLNIFTEEDLFFDLYAEVDNRDFKIVLSSFIKEVNKPYMLELMFDGTRGVWTVSDTMSTAYPIGISNGIRYMKGHPSLDNGVVISETDGVNKYKIMDSTSAFMDIEQYHYTDYNIVQKAANKIYVPINTIINLGNMSITNHLNKRFHEVQFEMTNINSNSIDMAYEFKVDGKTQQTSDRIVMEINDFILEERQQIEFETLDELSNMGFNNFLLDLSRFPISERIITRVAANGRGRIGSFRISFNITNDFEIFRFLIIYKEQTSRKVTQ